MTDAETKRTALERINILYKLAEQAPPKQARRYIILAKRIAMRTRTKIPLDLKKRTCKQCGTLLQPPANARIRLRPRRQPHIAMTCLNCGKITRYNVKRRT